MKMDFEYIEGATRIDEDELADLIPDLTTRQELDEFEAMNIAQAQIWLSRRPAKWTILDSQNCKQLHRRMFGEVWRWAGQNRKTAKNIGVESYRIESELRRLIDDANFWITNQTYGHEEIISRFHHRLVWIHLFANGNGRHARVAADQLAYQLRARPSDWGGSHLLRASESRSRYLTALRQADQGDFAELMAFMWPHSGSR